MKYVFLLLFSTLFHIFAFSSNEVTKMNALSAQKKYNFSICAVFKNEERFLKEWIEYHRLIGVDHFYLYNNGSVDLSSEILQTYVKKNIVTLISWPFFSRNHKDFVSSLGNKIPAYEHAIKLYASKETRWLVFLDIDEFLVPPDSNDFTSLLEKYDNYAGVTILSDFFDTSAVVFPKRRLVIETLELTNVPIENPQKKAEKMIFKPDLAKGFKWPPYKCIFDENLATIGVRKGEMKINRYLNRHKIDWHFDKPKEKMHVDHRTISDETLSQLLDLGYSIEDQECLIYKFIPELLKKLGLDSGWNFN